MRRVFLAAMMILCIFAPLSENSIAEPSSSLLETNSSGSIIIHRGETVEASITVSNLAETSQKIFFQNTLPNNISITNLPVEFDLSVNQIRQFKFNFYCDDFANYESVSAYINITSELDSEALESHEFVLTVSKQSDIRFGISDDSEYVVDPNIRTSLSVNLTNFGLHTDEVTFSISTSSSWEYGWNMNQTNGDKAIETFLSGDLKYVSLWVEVPPVIDSTPLAMTGPKFTLVATSGLDLVETEWSFELLMSEFRNVTVDQVGDNLSLSPDSSERLPITIRNVGNIENYASLKLELIDGDGNPISSVAQSDRLEYQGWIIAIFGGYEDELLIPSQQRTFEIGFQSPNINTGDINVRVIISPSGAADKTRYVELNSAIQWDREIDADLITDDCNQLLPGENCSADIRIYNKGNYQDIFSIEVYQKPDFVNISIDTQSLQIGKNSYQDILGITITASDSVLAFSNSEVIIATSINGLDEQTKYLTVNVVIAPEIDWTVQDLIEETDAIGRFNVAMTLRNDGNAIDGIIVQLQCSQYTTMSLVPPIGAEYEEGVEFPRSFEIDNITLGSNFTIRAWAEIPTDQISNGTMYLNISIRSRFTPDEPILFSSTVEFLGKPWQEVDDESDELTMSELFSRTEEIISSWIWIIISVAVSGIVINKAIRDRNERVKNQKLVEEISSEVNDDSQHNWMTKFEQNKQSVTKLESPQMPADKFEDAFRNKAGEAKSATQPVDERLRDAASLVLDTHDKTTVIKEADDLLLEIDKGGISEPASENKKLFLDEFTTKMTNRNDPQNLIANSTNETEAVDTVPLPKDDLDF